MTLRFKLPPGGDVPPIVAARRMGLSLDVFNLALPELVSSRGFPPADPTTGNYDLDAIDAWRRRRHPSLIENEAPGPKLATKAMIRERLIRAGSGESEKARGPRTGG